MTIISHITTAAQIAEEGIGLALEQRAAITMNARVLGAIRHRAKNDPLLERCLADKVVTVSATSDPGRYLAALLVGDVELAAIERHLMAIREDSVDLGYTSARAKHGFSRYAVDAAVESVQAAKKEIKEGGQNT